MHPVFVVEPSSRYRVSADLSLGGGVLGQINIGSAHAALVATNSEVQLNNFDANILGGHATGNATVSTARNGASRLATNFNNLDIGSLIATLTTRPVLISGKATGTANLSFPGTDITLASGTARVELKAETGDETSGRTPVNGEVALSATRGLFNIERANLRTPASELNATGQFSVERDESNLQLNLASNDAGELQNVLFSTGLLSDLDAKLASYRIKLGKPGENEFDKKEAEKQTVIELGGKLAFKVERACHRRASLARFSNRQWARSWLACSKHQHHARRS